MICKKDEYLIDCIIIYYYYYYSIIIVMYYVILIFVNDHIEFEMIVMCWCEGIVSLTVSDSEVRFSQHLGCC